MRHRQRRPETIPRTGARATIAVRLRSTGDTHESATCDVTLCARSSLPGVTVRSEWSRSPPSTAREPSDGDHGAGLEQGREIVDPRGRRTERRHAECDPSQGKSRGEVDRRRPSLLPADRAQTRPPRLDRRARTSRPAAATSHGSAGSGTVGAIIFPTTPHRAHGRRNAAKRSGSAHPYRSFARAAAWSGACENTAFIACQSGLRRNCASSGRARWGRPSGRLR